ncbi:hypothetical protein C1645_758795 [Glomus cerebriforme]|uniref:HMG box domain-containing protein n=1 Tax=Glomus cerebriforme TaxID=658196 RepID=A0A397TDD9_9GLOM|nr:hypothetical protein C1645_758795 [Glomus cerebriforme]
MPTAKDLLRDQKSSIKVKRPPNLNIIYTNRLNKFGLLEIIRKFCEQHGINKQKLIPLSKKVSKILWNELLSDQHRKFFEKLALEVSKEHKILYPTYKYQPKRKRNNYSTFRSYEP